MKIFEARVRVRYSETDQMGYVYYGNYAAYYEVGRVEMLRQMGTSYKNLEDSGVMMPVVHMECNYKRPARYDDLIIVKTHVLLFTGTRVEFEYNIFNETDQLLNNGKTTLVFIDSKNYRPCKSPEWFSELILSHYPML